MKDFEGRTWDLLLHAEAPPEGSPAAERLRMHGRGMYLDRILGITDIGRWRRFHDYPLVKFTMVREAGGPWGREIVTLNVDPAVHLPDEPLMDAMFAAGDDTLLFAGTYEPHEPAVRVLGPATFQVLLQRCLSIEVRGLLGHGKERAND